VIYLDDVPEEIEAELRAACLALPDAYEEQAWKGVRWMVRKKTFAHVLGVVDETKLPDGTDPRSADVDVDVVLSFRAAADELDVLRNAGHPFFYLGWGRDAMGMVLDANTDWQEVRELVTESFCVLAPKKLIALIDRPPPVADAL
jgi:hypothetical protein